MIVLKEKLCDYCGTCVAVCPENCITMGESHLAIDHDICTRCMRCVWVCPVAALEEFKKETKMVGNTEETPDIE